MKTNQKNNSSKTETMNKFSKFDSLKVSGLSAAITMLIATAISPTLHSADIEIYKVPEDSTGTATLLLMLDTSGSMAWNMGNTRPASAGNSRLDILKKGLKEVLEGTPTNPRVEDKIVMGLATFAGNNGKIVVPAKALGTPTGAQVVETTYTKPLWYRYEKNDGSRNRPNYVTYYNACTSWDSNNDNCLSWSGETKTQPSGFSTLSPYKVSNCNNYGDRNCNYIWSERYKYRDVTHRDTLLTAINGLTANGGTPTPYAYAEAAAYMMGTTSKYTNIGQYQKYFARNNTNKNYAICNTTWYGDGRCGGSWEGWYNNFNVPAGYIKGSSGEVGDYSGDFYLGAPTGDHSGFTSSVSEVRNGDNYIAPASITAQLAGTDAANAKKECSGQGIYFLTDGEPEPNGVAPNSTGTAGTAYWMMSSALSTKASLFNCADSRLGNRTGYKRASDGTHAWSCVGKLSQALLDPDKNPVGLQIKTAVVGFSSSFSNDSNDDVKDAKDWGTQGGGGWYVGTNSQSVVDSINNFIKEINKDIPSMSTGSSTIPIDALSARTIQPYAYSPQMEPKVRPEEKQQLWFGNLKKYYAVNNGIYADENGTGDPVVKESKLQDLADIWADNSVVYPEKTAVYSKGGHLGRVLLGITDTPANSFSRKILTDFDYDGTKAEAERYGRNFDLTRLSPNYTTAEKTKNETQYAKALMSLFGYQIPNETSTVGLDLSTLTPTLKQLGSVQHSLPILLTQEGKASATRDADGNVTVSYGDTREDYILFGSTQGLVHVLNAKDGTEVFSFLPKEIIEKQSETFKYNAGNTVNGKDALYYGMDGQWTAHTVYVTKPDGTQTVKEVARNVVGSATDKENLSGKQWVYGGMRMGGRSYYSLDLTNINDPKLKFHIDPSSGKVHKRVVDEDGNPTMVSTSYPAISNMGQSWSKPTLAYVNWKGKRKLVMFVGGGYDAGGDDGDGLWSNGVRTGYAGYENPKYKQDEDATSTKKSIGSGVYMFDADTGDLLWNAGSITAADLSVSDLKYSVVSEIKTVDRNNDGYTDHLYFGDLAGQAFRVDLKNDGASTFNAQATKILNLHQTNGTSPRFYVAPTFTAHRSGGKEEGANIVVAAFVSGNQSSPLLATTDSPTVYKDSIGFQFDGLYAVYDYDIHENKSGYPSTHIGARTLAATEDTADITKLKYINDALNGAIANKTSGWGGWYYQFNTKFNGNSSTAAVIKGLTNLYAMENSLYVTMFDASDNGTTSSCGAGVKGNSFAKRLCLPTGVCAEDANYTYNLGSGIVSLNVGDGGGGTKEIYVPDPGKVCVPKEGETTCTPCVGKDCDKDFIPSGGKPRLVPNRWYERFAQG